MKIIYPNAIHKWPPYLVWGVSLAIFGLLVLEALSIYQFNPIFVFWVILSAALIPITFTAQKTGLYVFLVVLVFVEFVKRLLFIFPEQVTPQVYLGTKIIPDIILTVSFLVIICLVKFIRKRRLIATKLDLLIAAYGLWNAVEILNPSLRLISGVAGFAYHSLPITLYFITREILRNRRDVVALYRWIIILGMIVGLYGFYHFLFGLNSFEITCHTTDVIGSMQLQQIYMAWLEGIEIIRLFSTFQSWKEFGTFLAFCILVLLIFKGHRSRVVFRKYRLLYSAFLVFLAFILINTFSRQNWLVLISAFLMVIYMRKSHFRWRYLLMLSPLYPLMYFGFLYILNLIVAMVQPLAQISSVASEVVFTTATLRERSMAWSQFWEDPTRFLSLWGHGIGAIFVAPRFQGLLAPHFHNGFLITLFEQGVVGLSLLYLIVLKVNQTGYRLYKICNRDIALREYIPHIELVIGFLFGLLMCYSFVQNIFENKIMNVFFWISLGILAHIYRQVQLVVNEQRRTVYTSAD